RQDGLRRSDESKLRRHRAIASGPGNEQDTKTSNQPGGSPPGGAPGPGASPVPNRSSSSRGGFAVPLPAARPDRRRLLRGVGVGLVGVPVGVGATLAAHGLGGGAGRAASVQRLDLPAGGVAAPAPTPRGAAACAPGRPGSPRGPRPRFLEAGAAADAATAYGLLDRAGRKRYPSPARFERAQADRPVATAVRVGHGRPTRGAAADVTVTLSHPAAIDPFAGLVPARTVEVWRASRQDGRWRVAADPVSVRADLPSDD